MPSRKVVSIFIIAVALVTTIVIVSPPKSVEKVTNSLSGSLMRGPEVKLAENPTWQGDFQNLSLSSDSSGIATSDVAKLDSETLTDEFSRSFFANYLALKQSGGINSAEAIKLIESSAAFVEGDSRPTYTMKDIIVSPDNSKTAVTKYGNDLGAAFKINAPPEKAENEIQIFNTMIENQNMQLESKLTTIASIYKNTATSLTQVTVPSTFAVNHLKLTQALASLGYSVTLLSQGLNDPVAAVRGLQEYTLNHTALGQAWYNLQVGLLQEGANYKQGENGYYFFFGI